MNTAQLAGMREVHETMAEITSGNPTTMTAREMALLPHTLSSTATFATLTDGTRYVWHGTLNVWVIF